MIIFFAWVIWIWIAIMVLLDVFRRHDIGGWRKAAWVVFVIVLPFLGVLVYLIAQHDGMRERRVQEMKAQTEGVRRLRARHGRRLRRRDRQGEGAARRGHDQPGRVRLDQGEGALLRRLPRSVGGELRVPASEDPGLSRSRTAHPSARSAGR